MSTLVMSAAAVVMTRGLGVVALWLQLRTQVRRDEARLRYLITALALPPDRDLVEVRPDCTRLHLTRVAQRTRGCPP